MTDLRTAAQQALEALYPISHNSTDDYRGQADKAIIALRAALEQPEQEPVAWLYPEGFEALKNGKCWTAYGTKQDAQCSVPVYLNGAVAPKVEPAQAECAGFDSQPASQRKQPEQEPVASIYVTIGGDREFDDWRCPLPVGCNLLYTSPPRREWRGLTEEEIYPLYREPSSDAEMVEFARAIEAALKERNA